jgi:hypothetical protein
MNGLNLQLPDDVVRDDAPPVADFEARPKTGMVIGLLAGAALIISFLFAYCVMNALAASDVIARWKPGADPRPKYFVLSFITVSALFGVIGFFARASSKRHLNKIDAMESDEDDASLRTGSLK